MKFTYFLTAVLTLLTLHQNLDAQVETAHSKEFTIENCVNSLDMDKTVPTDVGYQYWFVDQDFLDGRTLKLSVVEPHKATHAPHSHAADAFFLVIEGTAEFYLNGETALGGGYTSFYCPPNSTHGIRNVGDTELKYLVIKKYLNK